MRRKILEKDKASAILKDAELDFYVRHEYVDAIRVGWQAIDGIMALSNDVRAVDRSAMPKEVLAGFNIALALMNKNLCGVEVIP